MARMVRPGEQGVDFSFAHPPAARLLELGYTFIVGYISIPPASPAKNLSAAECEAYVAAGLKVLLVWEMSASRATLGAVYGTADGANARVQAQARGYPTDIPIIIADDCATTAANIRAKEAYMRSAAASAAPYSIAIYAGCKTLERCAGLWQIGWVPTTAWSWSVSLARLPGETTADYNKRGQAAAEAKARDLGAHVLQRKGFYLDDTWAVDPNDVIADFPAWGSPLPTPEPPSPHPPEEDIMQIRLLILTDSQAQFLAETTPAGVALHCTWAGPGSPKVDAWVAAHRAEATRAGYPFEQTGDVAGLANVILDGPLPFGDGKHQWDGSEFARTDVVGTVDPKARDDIAALNVAVANVGQILGDTQNHLRQAGTPG